MFPKPHRNSAYKGGVFQKATAIQHGELTSNPKPHSLQLSHSVKPEGVAFQDRLRLCQAIVHGNSSCSKRKTESERLQAVPPKKLARTRNGFLQKLGPGLITGASDDDPSGIGTYSQVGAQIRLWPALDDGFVLSVDDRYPGD